MLDQRDIIGNIDLFITNLFTTAINKRASDIHIEAEKDYARIRLRIDGRLCEIMRIHLENYSRLISKIKLMANMDIAERRKPQDSSLKLDQFRNIDFRVSTIDTNNGEKLVIRVLSAIDYENKSKLIGFSDDSKDKLNNAMKNRSGMVILSGPTGSGKSTTLYSLLRSLNREEENIITVEDPVEYDIEGINQVQVNEKIGFTFAKALRSILRQDPDIIMIGEIRDRETADIAIRSAITGHLVLTTLHTNNALSAIIRLKDLGIENYLLSSAISTVASQRLVRKLCECKKADKLTDDEYKIISEFVDIDRDIETFRPKGCPNCNEGYLGREACEEVFILTDEFRDMVRNNQIDLVSLNAYAKDNNFKSMVVAGFEKVINGITSFDEIIGVMFDQI